MIILPWYLFSIVCMASFAIAWVLLSLLTSGRIDDLNSAIAVARKEAAEWKTLAELYHEGLHKQADKVHSGKLAEIESGGQKDDYIDWSKVPDGYDWVAVDGEDFYADGIVRCYKSIPYIGSDGCMFFLDNIDSDIAITQDAIIGPLPPWRESLRKRPGK